MNMQRIFNLNLWYERYTKIKDPLNRKIYKRGIYKAFHFYFKPGICYERYPRPLDPQYNKFVRNWLKFITGNRKSIRTVWDTYNQIMNERNINDLKLLLEKVEDMIQLMRKGKKFHNSMSKDEESISLKKLAIYLYFEIGSFLECNKKYDEALENYDKAAQIVGKDELELIPTRERIYSTIRGFAKRRAENKHYDVLLINVGWSTEVLPWPIMVLGSKLVKENKSVKLMDGFSEELDILKEAGFARLIGFSVMTAQIKPSLRLSRQIKKLYPDKFIVWGGVHPTLFPEQCLQEKSIDFVVCGDGEEALTNLSNCLENNEYSFDKIPGLGYKNNGSPAINLMGKPYRFENSGPWELELLDMKNYMNWNLMLVNFKHPSLSLLATRGCPRGCTFCINSVVKHTRIHRARPVDSVLDEIENLIKKYNARTINFPDEAFFISPDYFASFIEGIQKRNLKFEWGGGAHIADVLRNKDLILSAKKAGLVWTGGSGESGSNRLLKLLNKGITVEETIECMHFLADNGLMTASCYMTYLPTEAPNETKATLKLLEQIQEIFKKRNNNSYIMGPSIFRPYPGSKLYNMCVESGFKTPETLEEWEKMVSPDGNFKINNITWLGPGY